MSEIVVRGLEQDELDRLEAKAKASGTSLEDFARKTLRDAARPSREDLLADIDRIRAMTKPADFDSTAYIREGRDRGWRGD